MPNPLIMTIDTGVKIESKTPNSVYGDSYRQFSGKLSIYDSIIVCHSKSIDFSITRILAVNFIPADTTRQYPQISVDFIDNLGNNLLVYFGPNSIIDQSWSWKSAAQQLYTTILNWKQTNEYAEGINFENTMQYENALKIYASLSKIQDCHRIRIKQATIFEQNKHFDDAIEIYKSLNMPNEVYRLLINKAKNAEIKHEYDVAIHIYRLMGNNAEQRNAMELKAHYLEQIRQFEGAINIYRMLDQPDEIKRLLLVEEQLFEEAYRFEDAAKILEQLGRFKDAGELRKKSIQQNASVTRVDIGSIDKSTHIHDSVINRSTIGDTSSSFNNCPYCGKTFDLPKMPSYCPYCKEKLIK
jgi:tetratricopeptide (TPR) repeat protein